MVLPAPRADCGALQVGEDDKKPQAMAYKNYIVSVKVVSA
jgi:hypothetical protein